MCASVGCTRNTTTVTQPVLSVMPSHLELGEVVLTEDRKLPIRFEIANRGNDVLRLEEIVPSCQCSDVGVGKSVLLPGESTTLFGNILLEPTPRHGSAAFDLFTNDPAQPHIRLTAQWRTVAIVEFRPASLEIGAIKPGEMVERIVEVVFRDEVEYQDLKVLEIASNHPEVESSLSEQEDSESGEAAESMGRPVLTRVRVCVQSGEEPGDKTAFVTLTLNDSSIRPQRLPVHWRCQPEIIIEPASVFLGAVSPGTSVERDVVVSADSNSEFSIDRIEAEGDGVSAVLQKPLHVSREHRVTVTLVAPNAPGVFRGRVILHTSRTAYRVLIPVSALIR
jgi:hypothetical protein